MISVFIPCFDAAHASFPRHIIEEIRQAYQKCEGVVLSIPWCDRFNFQIEDIFTRLRIVTKENTRGLETTKEVTNMTSIFMPHECCEQPLIVLIEGEPGMGKTTYCQKLAFDWASEQRCKWDESFPRVDVLLFLRCREIKSTIWEAIKEQVLRDKIKPDDKEVFLKFLEENPSKVLLVLDGLDEVDPQTLEMLLYLVQREQLPCSYIVLTSRHEVGRKVRPYTHTLLKIVGFTTTDAECFIRKYFQHAKQLAEELISEVKCNLDLRALTKNPLNNLLLCAVFEDLEGILPTNRTQLYVEIVLFLLRRYESKNGLSNRGKDHLLAYRKELMILGKTALDYLRKGELYFDDHKGDIKESLLLKLGFLSIQSGGSKSARCDRYGFFHKSFQEFFSGYFLAFSLIDDVSVSHSVLTDERYMGELFHVFKFMSGIIALRSEETAVVIVQGIASIVNETGGTSDKFVSNLRFAHELINECKACSGSLSRKLDRSFGESLKLVDVVARPSNFPRDSKCIETFFKALTYNSTVSRLNLFEWGLSIKFTDLLAQALRVNSSLSSLDLTDNSIDDDGAFSLAQALRKHASLYSLNLDTNSIGAEGAKSLARALTENTSLFSLDYSSNFIGNEGANSLARALVVNTSLSYLDLPKNSIGRAGGGSLGRALRVNRSLSSLDLSKNSIDDEGADLLAWGLRENTSLSSLVLSYNSIGAEGANSLARALRVNSSLSSLDLTGNSIVDEGAYSLARALRKHTSLSFLNLGANSVGAEGAKSLARALRENTSLSSLNLDANSIGAEGAKSFALALKENRSLSSLDLSSNFIGNEGARSLAEALRVNTSLFFLYLCDNSIDWGSADFLVGPGSLSYLYLSENSFRCGGAYMLGQSVRLSLLDLSMNSIGDEEADQLARGLRGNTSICCLKLFCNSIGDVGAHSLAEALRVNSSLSCLELYSNDIYPEGANSLAEALTENNSLSSLDLHLNFIGPEGANSIADALRVNTFLLSLDLSTNFISNAGANSLAQALRENTSLSFLGLSCNAIGDEGANSLAQALRVNSSLSSLDLRRNPIGSEGANSLAQAHRVSSSLSSLDLSDNSTGDE